MSILKVASAFSTAPGPGLIEDGPNSGELFFDLHLNNSFKEAVSKGQKLLVDLDDTNGYVASFLNEAFGRLSDEHGADYVNDNIDIKSDKIPDWIYAIRAHYICKNTKRTKRQPLAKRVADACSTYLRNQSANATKAY